MMDDKKTDPLIVTLVNALLDAGVLVIVDERICVCEHRRRTDGVKSTPLDMTFDISKTNIDKEMELLRDHEAKKMQESVTWARGVLSEFTQPDTDE